MEGGQDASAVPDEKPHSVQRKNSEFTGLEREHENKGSSSSKSGDVLWEDREASAPLPRDAYVVISCKMHNVLAAGTGTSDCFCPRSWMSAARTRLLYEAGIKMTPEAAGAILPLKSCIRPINDFRY